MKTARIAIAATASGGGSIAPDLDGRPGPTRLPTGSANSPTTPGLDARSSKIAARTRRVAAPANDNFIFRQALKK